jgi:hypothetical protein
MKAAAVGSVFALCFALVSGVSHAGDLAVRYSLGVVEAKGPLTTGTVNVTVSNVGKSVLRNVDVRLALPGPNAIEKPLLQLGTIPAGEARVAQGRFMFDSAFHASGTPLAWRVDYDAAGKHHQVVLQGTQIRR